MGVAGRTANVFIGRNNTRDGQLQKRQIGAGVSTVLMQAEAHMPSHHANLVALLYGELAKRRHSVAAGGADGITDLAWIFSCQDRMQGGATGFRKVQE